MSNLQSWEEGDMDAVIIDVKKFTENSIDIHS
jgi:hypothetical protein